MALTPIIGTTDNETKVSLGLSINRITEPPRAEFKYLNPLAKLAVTALAATRVSSEILEPGRGFRKQIIKRCRVYEHAGLPDEEKLRCWF
mmetsp:Transcript_5130/g.8238  ORF Transcript_5130/g.8238 Transcript_5130/m.8238 type:complete len:90 (+) Transcript_5130:1316-1585(+)